MINDVIQAKQPMVIADVTTYRGCSLLVTHVYDKGRTVGKLVTPMQEITDLTEKISEVVEKSCEREKPITYDLHTCSDIIYKEALPSAHVLVQMESECKECEEIMHDFAAIAALNDL